MQSGTAGKCAPWSGSVALVAWVMANGLDILSVALDNRAGPILAPCRRHPGECLVIYAAMRLLGTLAVGLAAVCAEKRWPVGERAVWTALTVFSFAAAAVAWWRLYR